MRVLTGLTGGSAGRFGSVLPAAGRLDTFFFDTCFFAAFLALVFLAIAPLPAMWKSTNRA